MSGPPSRWLVVSVRPPDPDATDVVADVLIALGGRAVVEEPDGTLVTHLADPRDPGAVVDAVRRAVAASLDGVEVEVRTSWQPHRDWAEVWKRGLGPRRVTERLVVTPSWCAPETRPGDLVIVVDPGIAFGTAEHGTTRGCLRLLDGAVAPGARVMDVGAGSGILSIAAARLGAASVLALESDPWAVETARDNVRANGVQDKVEVLHAQARPDDLPALGPRDGVVSNIETAVLRDLLPGFLGALTTGGWLILSGIPDTEWSEMIGHTRRAGIRLEAQDRDGEWCAGRFRPR